MARRAQHEPLNVFLNARLVGQLRRETSGAIDFRYDASWLSWEHTLPVSLSLPLREDRYVGAPVVVDARWAAASRAAGGLLPGTVGTAK
jgi:serine/threonine-protein kinase HipA